MVELENALSQWFAIRTAPQREAAVEAMLRIKGYTVFLPIEVKYRRAHRSHGKRVAVSYPMFTRYIFVRAPFSWLHLLAERHITGVVGFDGSPAPIPESEIERVRSMSGAVVPHRHSVNPHRSIRCGEKAVISDGPFAGAVVTISALHGRKAEVFLSLFGGRRVVSVDPDNLRAA